jgi:hypothetical protein
VRDGDESLGKEELSSSGTRWPAQIILFFVSILVALIFISWDLWYCTINSGAWIFSSGSQVSSTLE